MFFPETKRRSPVRVETLLNKVYSFKSFVYSKVHFETQSNEDVLVIEIAPRKNGQVHCSRCRRQCPVYDRMADTRDFDFIPLWNIRVVFRYRMRRVRCPVCGVKVERIPWADGKMRIAKPFQLFLAVWAERLSWKETANAFHTSWDSVYRSVEHVVSYGLKHRNINNIAAIGVDEVQVHAGHNYITLVYQIDAGIRRLLYVGKGRTVKSLLGFFREIGKGKSQRIKFVCSDMWKPYLKVIGKKAPQALHVLDRFHVVQHMGKAIDKIRNEEAKRLEKEGFENVLKRSKYCFLKNEENLTDKQKTKLDDILKYDLKTVRAYLLKQSFRLFWTYKSPYWAERYLEKWCASAMRSQLEPIKKFVKTVRNHQSLIMNYFKAMKAYSSGVVEGLNRKVNLVTRKSYGFRSDKILGIALLHHLGKLPRPEFNHKFC